MKAQPIWSILPVITQTILPATTQTTNVQYKQVKVQSVEQPHLPEEWLDLHVPDVFVPMHISMFFYIRWMTWVLIQKHKGKR